jgi:hypothetical protein
VHSLTSVASVSGVCRDRPRNRPSRRPNRDLIICLFFCRETRTRPIGLFPPWQDRFDTPRKPRAGRESALPRKNPMVSTVAPVSMRRCARAAFLARNAGPGRDAWRGCLGFSRVHAL